MAKETRSTVVPRLRFPKFLGSGGWVRAPLGKLFSERQEAGFIDLPLLSLTEKQGIIRQDETNRRNNSNADKSKYLRVVRGDIAYNTMRMWEGRSAYVGIEGLVSPAYTVCAPNKGTCSPFFAFYFKTAPLVRQFRQFSQGLVKDTLNLKYQAFSRIEIAYPSDEDEQYKIAECLTSLNEVIAAQRRKVAVLKTYKSGLMQQLFPREGETVPGFRFAEFRNSGPWHLRKLGDLLQERKQRNRDLKFGASEVLSVSGDYGCVNQIEHLGRSYAGVSVKDYHVVEMGDLVYTKSPLKKSPYGIIKENKGKPGIVSTLYAVYRATELGHPAYLDHYFSRDYTLNSYLQPIVKKGAKNDMKVNNTAVLSGDVLAPDTSEQHKIAQCLTSLDTLIATEHQKVEAFETYKQGIMQQLFPTPEET